MYDPDSVRLPFSSWLVALVLLVGAARAQVPTLDHGPPFLGGVLELVVEGAPPGARVTYIHSPSAGNVSTPYGVLELHRPTAARIGTTFADGNGQAVFGVSLPLDANLVQTEAHYQALVADPNAPAGAVLSGAVALRWLGPRAYVGTRGRSSGPSGVQPGGLEIIDLVHDVSVGRIDYPGPVPAGEGDGEPVFSANQARGALMASPTELVIFDPFFATTLGVLNFQNASRSLLRSPDGERVHVLEMSVAGGARISSVDLASGQVVSTIALPAPTRGLWALDEASNTAFVCELAGSGQTALRVVDMTAGSAGLAYDIGGGGSAVFDDLLLSAGQLLVATRTVEVGQNFEGRFTRATLPLSNSSMRVDSFAQERLTELTPMPALDLLLTFFMQPFVPSGALCKTRLATAAPWGGCGLPWVYLHVDGVTIDAATAWVIDAAGNEPPTASELGKLYSLEPLTNSWTTYPRSWFSGPSAVASVTDALAHKLLVSAPGEDLPIIISPELLIIDLVTSGEQTVSIGWEPESLKVVPLP